MGAARTEVNCSDTHCIYDNLWYNNGRFFLLVDGSDPVVRLHSSRQALYVAVTQGIVLLSLKRGEHGHLIVRTVLLCCTCQSGYVRRGRNGQHVCNVLPNVGSVPSMDIFYSLRSAT